MYNGPLYMYSRTLNETGGFTGEGSPPPYKNLMACKIRHEVRSVGQKSSRLVCEIATKTV